MNQKDLKISFNLALVYCFNLLGMFLLLPVLMIYALNLPNSTIVLSGFAFGAYGLMRLIMQLILGVLSDYYGRKKIIYLGLTLFILGSLVCASAPDIKWLIIGRLIQGSGAVGAVVSALVADLTSAENRTGAMAIIGISIGVAFAVSVVLAPILAHAIGVQGIFYLTALFAFISILIIVKLIPHPVKLSSINHISLTNNWLLELKLVLKNPELLRLNFGIFCLHFTQMALFIALPLYLINVLAIDKIHQWYLYLPAVMLGFLLMIPLIVIAEKRKLLKKIMILGVLLLLISQILLWHGAYHLPAMIGILTIYFIGFNLMEALLPSLVSKISPDGSKGTALGVQTTCQSLGLFLGASLGGIILAQYGLNYIYLISTLLLLLWFILLIKMKNPLNLAVK